MNVSGIYTITNKVNGKRYVGSAVSLAQRKRQHWSDLNLGCHRNQILQRSWVKNGASSFVFTPILVCSKADLLTYEQIAIDAMRPEYNICLKAGSRLGTRHTEESKAKQSAAKTGKPGPWAGKKLSLEHREKLAAAKRGKKPVNFGIPCSEEQKAKIRAKLTKPKQPKPPREYRVVVNALTGTRFRSIADAAKSIGMTACALGFRLRGTTPNNTSMRYAE